MQWFYALQNQRQGPVGDADFHRLVSEGVIEPSTLVWRAGMPNWQPYETIAPTLVPPIPTSDAPVSTAAIPAGNVIPNETAVCLISGKTYPKSQMMEYQGRWVSLENREEFFRRIRDGEIMPGSVNYAGFWIRAVAWIINFIIVYICWQLLDFLLILGHVIPRPLTDVNPMDPTMAPAILQHAVPGMLINFAFAILYSVFFNWKLGATPGKLIFGLRIVLADGERAGVGRLVLRAVVQILTSLMLFIGFFVVGIDDQKRGLPDLVCGTRVIKTR